MGVDIIILISNERDKSFLMKCVNSIDFFDKIIIVNNHSDFVKRSNNDNVQIIKNNGQGGFADGNNLGIKNSDSDFVMLVNADIEFEKGCLKKLIHEMETGDKIGFVVPKLLKPWDKKTIDSTGIARSSLGHFFDRGRGEIDKGQYDSSTAIRAGCGAALLFRKSALNDIKMYNEYLDEDFFTYLEDVDICWRLSKNGWSGRFVPKAVAYHHRGHELEIPENKSLFSFIINRIKQKKKDEYYKNIRRWVFRNNYWLLLKNQPIGLKLLPVLFGLFLRTIFGIIVEPYILSEVPTILKKTPKMIKKRYGL